MQAWHESCSIDTNTQETLADNRNLWKQQVSPGVKTGEAAIIDKSDERRARRITCHQQDHPAPQPVSVFICQGRSRDYKSRINWPIQQQKTMFLNKLARCYSIVKFDWRVPTTA